MMGFITIVGTLSFLFTGPHRHSSFPSTGYTSLCLEASPESSKNNKQPLSAWNNTVTKFGIEKALEIQRENGRKGNKAFNEKYGSAFNATAQKYGLEKAKEIYRDNARKRTEKYGSLFNLSAQKYGLERAKEIWSESARKRTEKYGTVLDRMKSKHGLGKANEINRQSMRKAREAFEAKYRMEEIQQMSSSIGVKSARKNGKYTRYPGVFRTGTGKWRVQFSFKGKIHRAGSAHTTEYEAALAHDDYVRKLGMKRPLHFPRKGERTSYVDEPSDNA